jgi:hypothetical protein
VLSWSGNSLSWKLKVYHRVYNTTTGPCPASDESNQTRHILLLQVHVNIIVSLTLRLPACPLFPPDLRLDGSLHLFIATGHFVRLCLITLMMINSYRVDSQIKELLINCMQFVSSSRCNSH